MPSAYQSSCLPAKVLRPSLVQHLTPTHRSQPTRAAWILMGGWCATAQPCIENQVLGELQEQGMQS